MLIVVVLAPQRFVDPRVERVVRLLFDADLDALPADARETDVARALSTELMGLRSLLRRGGIGIDGSARDPDDACELPATGELGPLEVAIEYKLYRNRKQAAGEMDRALGQSIAYAEQYGAVLFFVVYMGPPQHALPVHWLDRTAPLRVGHKIPGVPVYFAARPRSWSDPWADRFSR